MLAMFITRRRCISETLAILALVVFVGLPAGAAGDGRLTSGLQHLIERGAGGGLVRWQEDLAELCTATIRAGGSDAPIIFKARPVKELLVHYRGSFTGLTSLWAERVVFRNDRLNYVVVRIPPGTAAASFARELSSLQSAPGVRLIEPRCLPARDSASEEDEGPCVSPEKLAVALGPVSQTRDVPDCDAPSFDKNRKAIGLPQLLAGPSGNTTLVAVVDVGFDQFNDLGQALGTADYKNNGSTIAGVSGWDYCENDASIDGDPHGTQMSGLVGASCTQFSDAPGVAQSSLVVGMKTFYENGNGTHGFAGPEALAAAIQDAHSMGARVVNMSFTIHPTSDDGWTPVRTALEQAGDVVFVTGPWEGGELPYPARLEPDNMILVGARKWNRDGELTAHTWGSSLHIDAPWAGQLVIPPQLSGASNAIAFVSGAVADLLGRPGCGSLTPDDTRDILVENGEPPSDSASRPLLQVDFLTDPDCH